MHAIALLGAAAALCRPAMAMPKATPAAAALDLARRANLEPRADPTAPWVTVDDEGKPVKTITPVTTTISGTPTLVSVAPHDITASVYTWTTWGSITTSTGRPPNPTAASKNGDGVFARCYNKDGDDAPFCSPYNSSTLLTGNTYYITWDPDYYNKTGSSAKVSNSTYEITVRLDYLNKTSNEYVKLQTFDQDRVPTSWGVWPLTVTSGMLKGQKTNNVTITLQVAPRGSKDSNSSVPLHVAIQDPALPSNPEPQVPKGRTLSIALPVALGGVLFIVVGVFLWNRSARRIHLGSIMGRSRHGYSGRKARRNNNLFRPGGYQKDAASIQLHNADDHLSDGEYHDAPISGRRDSEALGSLAGTPTNESFEHHQGSTTRNAFRDELDRQHQERRGY